MNESLNFFTFFLKLSTLKRFLERHKNQQQRPPQYLHKSHSSFITGLPYLWMTSSPGSLHSNRAAAGSSVAPLSSPLRSLNVKFHTPQARLSDRQLVSLRRIQVKSATIITCQPDMSSALIGRGAKWAGISFSEQVLTLFCSRLGITWRRDSAPKLIRLCRTNRCVWIPSQKWLKRLLCRAIEL